MYDFMIRILPNNRILVRNTSTGASRTMKATQVSGYIENVLEEQIEAQKELDRKVAEIKQQVEPEGPPEGCDHEFGLYLPYNEVQVAAQCSKCGELEIKGKDEVK